jgi:hypothetical protein
MPWSGLTEWVKSWPNKLMDSFTLTVLDGLAAASSDLEKEEILLANTDLPTLKTVFRLALDPAISFPIDGKDVPGEPWKGAFYGWTMNLSDALMAVEEWLVGRKVTGPDAIAWVHRLFAQLESSSREVVRRVISRDLKCSASEELLKKVWPDMRLGYPRNSG